MSDEKGDQGGVGLAIGLRSIVRGTEDDRVRATWRVLLAVPLFWLLAGGVAGTVQAVVPAIPAGGEVGGGLAISLLHGGLFGVVLVGWARYLDRQPLSDYGVSASPTWLRDVLLGFGAVVVAFGIWFGLLSAAGYAGVSVSLSAGGSLPLQLGLLFVALVVHAALQDLVFFRIVLRTAGRGLQSRGVAAQRAAVAGLLVTLLLFLGVHDLASAVRILDLVVAGAVFGLLYLHTGDLALSIGAHFGSLYAGIALFVPASRAGSNPAVLSVTQSLPGSLAVLRSGFPKVVTAYLLLVAYVRWRRGAVSLDVGLSRGEER